MRGFLKYERYMLAWLTYIVYVEENSLNIELNILKCSVQQRLVYSQCCAIISFIQLQNIFMGLTGNPISIN